MPHPTLARCATVLVCIAPMLAYAQASPMPGQIKGRWTYQGSASNTFSLSDIKVGADQTFSAKLEWWTLNPRCVVRDEAISGKVTDKGVTWYFVTKPPCNRPYVAELVRAESGWQGQITGQDNTVAELKAQ